MRARRMALFLCVGFLLLACSGDDARGPQPDPLAELLEETIEFETSTFPGQWLSPFMPPAAAGEPTSITGRLLVPPTEVPLPVVLITHGCGGVGGSELGFSRELEAAGIASFVIDSFSSRNIGSACDGGDGINQASLLVDLYRAAEALAGHPYVDDSRTVVLGFSMGGRTALWSSLERFQEQYGGRPLAGYAAFYPLGCYIQLERETAVAGGPIRIFHGEDDDWLPIAQCEDYVARLGGAGVDIDLFRYEGAHHSFDDRGLTTSLFLAGALSPRSCSVVETDGVLSETGSGEAATSSASCVERGATIAYSADARAEAVADVLAFLSSIFDE